MADTTTRITTQWPELFKPKTKDQPGIKIDAFFDAFINASIENNMELTPPDNKPRTLVIDTAQFMRDLHLFAVLELQKRGELDKLYIGTWPDYDHLAGYLRWQVEEGMNKRLGIEPGQLKIFTLQLA